MLKIFQKQKSADFQKAHIFSHHNNIICIFYCYLQHKTCLHKCIFKEAHFCKLKKRASLALKSQFCGNLKKSKIILLQFPKKEAFLRLWGSLIRSGVCKKRRPVLLSNGQQSVSHSIFIADLFLGARKRRLVSRPPLRPQCDATNSCDRNLCSRFCLLYDLYPQKLVNCKFFYLLYLLSTCWGKNQFLVQKFIFEFYFCF